MHEVSNLKTTLRSEDYTFKNRLNRVQIGFMWFQNNAFPPTHAMLTLHIRMNERRNVVARV